jgi:ATP-dependent protease ClpP protease subunit
MTKEYTQLELFSQGSEESVLDEGPDTSPILLSVNGELGKDDLVKSLLGIQAEMLVNNPEIDPTHLILMINSPGGSLEEAFAAVNLLEVIGKPVVTVANTSAHSAGLMLLANGTKRIVLPDSIGMTHTFATSTGGSYHNIKDSMEHMKILEENLVSNYMKKTKQSEFVVRNTFFGRKDLFMDSYDLVRYGFADKEVLPKNLMAELRVP